MSIMLLSDIHGNIGVLKDCINKAEANGASAVIQVGDFGLFPRDGIDLGFLRVVKDAQIPVYFIEGNHDDCDRWIQLEEVTQVFDSAKNFFYIPRGTVMEIDGRTIAFMGGAASIDRKLRERTGLFWTDAENIREEQANLLLENAKGKKIDMFITHMPANSVIIEHFDPLDKLFFEVDINWTDPNGVIIERLWKELGYPYNYSGHMHKEVIGQTYRILDINQSLEV